MSASQWDRSSASADGLLTNEECSMLLEFDFFCDENDLLKSFPSAASKLECGKFPTEEATDATSLYPPSPPDTKPSRAELAHDLLQQLDNQCKQENIFSNWLEEKVELPIFENINQVVERVEVPYVAPPPPPTEELLREFESVCGAVELTHLTPPQSPPATTPGPATQLLQSFAQHQYVPTVAITVAPAPAQLAAWPALDTDLQAVDELVRQLQSPAESSSPRSSAPSSPRSSTDDEWSTSSRPKPYSRPSDDRRSRKKEQNKNAATRYRQKKKAEVEVLLGEEQALRQHHTDLDEKCSDLQREIRYLKGLMRDLFKAKGLIK